MAVRERPLSVVQVGFGLWGLSWAQLGLLALLGALHLCFCLNQLILKLLFALAGMGQWLPPLVLALAVP